VDVWQSQLQVSLPNDVDLHGASKHQSINQSINQLDQQLEQQQALQQ
jgi:hypothetical protein